MQYLKISTMQDKLDDMDCGQENKISNIQFVPKTELDYLLLGCMLESQQMSPTQSSPNTQRTYSLYQKQFENHKKKGQQMGFKTNNGSSAFSMPFPQNNMTSGQSQYNTNFNMQGKMPFQNYNGHNTNQNINNMQMQNNKLNLTRVNNNNNNNNIPKQQQNVPPNNNINMIMDDDMDLSSENTKKEKKKPKRPNKVKPMGCEWCKVTSSPVWRGGPSGKGSLCNACGLQHMKGFTMERAKETLRKSRGEWKINSQM